MRKNITALLAAFALAGCSALVPTPYERMTIRSDPDTGIHCTLTNDRGTWSLITPGEVIVARSSTPLKIRCDKPGYTVGAENVTAENNYNGHATFQMEPRQ